MLIQVKMSLNPPNYNIQIHIISIIQIIFIKTQGSDPKSPEVNYFLHSDLVSENFPVIPLPPPQPHLGTKTTQSSLSSGYNQYPWVQGLLRPKRKYKLGQSIVSMFRVLFSLHGSPGIPSLPLVFRSNPPLPLLLPWI